MSDFSVTVGLLSSHFKSRNSHTLIQHIWLLETCHFLCGARNYSSGKTKSVLTDILLGREIQQQTNIQIIGKILNKVEDTRVEMRKQCYLKSSKYKFIFPVDQIGVSSAYIFTCSFDHIYNKVLLEHTTYV